MERVNRSLLYAGPLSLTITNPARQWWVKAIVNEWQLEQLLGGVDNALQGLHGFDGALCATRRAGQADFAGVVHHTGEVPEASPGGFEDGEIGLPYPVSSGGRSHEDRSARPRQLAARPPGSERGAAARDAPVPVSPRPG